MNNDDHAEPAKVYSFPDSVKTITNSQFSSYLKHVGASQSCLSCGKAGLISVQDVNWDKINDQGDFDNIEKYSFLRLYQLRAETSHLEWDATELDSFDYEFRIVCKHCGHVTSYMAWLVYSWLKKQG